MRARSRGGGWEGPGRVMEMDGESGVVRILCV